MEFVDFHATHQWCACNNKTELDSSYIFAMFLFLRSDAIRPHCLTSKPLDHTIAHLRMIIREFTVLVLVDAINQMHRLIVATHDRLKKY